MKNQLTNQKNKYLTIIYDGVLKHKPVRDIHRDLFKATINPNKPLLAYMVKIANRAKKLDKGAGQYYGTAGLDVLAMAIFSLFTTDATNYKATKLINSEVRKFESEQKFVILTNAWKENRMNGKIFYIASSHADSAEDHKDWQGKIYVDRYWHNYADSEGRLEKFIRDNGIRTAQWVTGKPVWFITRPNCRHYFVNYSIEDVLRGKYKIPRRKVGNRKLQTPRDVNLQYYEDRLALYEMLYRKHPTPTLKKQIEKTKLLITKWKKLF